MAMIAEMIHTSSLLHDDVIDDAITRRNKPSVNQCFTQKEAILAGDFILSKAAILLAQLKSTQAVANFSQIINDLVKGNEVFFEKDYENKYDIYDMTWIAVALDISKAFNRVWHAGLLHKLRSYGISGQIFGHISSILSNRRLRVVLDGKSSQEYPVDAGVPQGSILSPTLFLLCIIPTIH